AAAALGRTLHARCDKRRPGRARPRRTCGLVGVTTPRAREGEASGRRDEPVNRVELRLALAERVDDARVELPCRLGEDLASRLLPRASGPVGAVARDRVERVRDGED